MKPDRLDELVFKAIEEDHGPDTGHIKMRIGSTTPIESQKRRGWFGWLRRKRVRLSQPSFSEIHESLQRLSDSGKIVSITTVDYPTGHPWTFYLTAEQEKRYQPDTRHPLERLADLQGR